MEGFSKNYHIYAFSQHLLRPKGHRQMHRRPQPLSPNKSQQLDSYPRTKTFLGELWSPYKKLQQHSRILKKRLRITTQKEKRKQLHFPCIFPSPELALLTAKKEFPATVSHTKKKEWSEPPDFLAFGGTAWRSCFNFPLTKTGKAEILEILNAYLYRGTMKNSRCSW